VRRPIEMQVARNSASFSRRFMGTFGTQSGKSAGIPFSPENIPPACFGDAPACFGDAPACFGDAPACFGDAPACFGDAPACYGLALACYGGALARIGSAPGLAWVMPRLARGAAEGDQGSGKRRSVSLQLEGNAPSLPISRAERSCGVARGAAGADLACSGGLWPSLA